MGAPTARGGPHGRRPRLGRAVATLAALLQVGTMWPCSDGPASGPDATRFEHSLGLNGLNQTLHVRNGSAGTSYRLATFLGSIRCCKMSTFTLSRCGEAVVVGLVRHETSKVARRASCGRPQPWGVGRFSAHRASAPLCALDPEMTMGTTIGWLFHIFAGH